MRIARALITAVVSLTAVAGPARLLAEPSSPFNYVYEIWYDVERDMGPQLDLYFAKLKELADSKPRWVDTHSESNRRIVSVPAARLGDFGGDRHNEAGLRKMLGDEAYRELSKGYADAQLARRSFIRQYRTELSLNPQHHTRSGVWATEYVLVTVEPDKEKQFERLWRVAMTAYAKVSPHAVLITAKTIVGGGPQYAVTRLLKDGSELESLPSPAEAVRLAFGSAESQTFRERFDQSVNKWDKLVLVRTNLDADGTVPARAQNR